MLLLVFKLSKETRTIFVAVTIAACKHQNMFTAATVTAACLTVEVASSGHQRNCNFSLYSEMLFFFLTLKAA